MNNISKSSIWKNTLNTCSTLTFLYCEHYCCYFHIQEKAFLAKEQQHWTDIGRMSDRKLGTFKTKSFGWFTASLEQLISARTGRWLVIQPAPELPHTVQHIHHVPQGDGPAQRGGRRVALPSSRPVLLQKVHMNENEVRLLKVCMSTWGFSLNYNILLVAQKFTDSVMLSRMASPHPTLHLTGKLTFSNRGNTGFGLKRSLWLTASHCLPFVLSLYFHRLCIMPLISPKDVV